MAVVVYGVVVAQGGVVVATDAASATASVVIARVVGRGRDEQKVIGVEEIA